MAGFTLHLQDATQYERIEGVTSFVGEDASGQFGLLPGAERFMTMLELGLARFRSGAEAPWRFVAVSGGLVYFVDGALYLSTSHFVLGDDPRALADELEAIQEAEEAQVQAFRKSLHQMEEEMFRRLWRLRRGA